MMMVELIRLGEEEGEEDVHLRLRAALDECNRQDRKMQGYDRFLMLKTGPVAGQVIPRLPWSPDYRRLT